MNETEKSLAIAGMILLGSFLFFAWWASRQIEKRSEPVPTPSAHEEPRTTPTPCRTSDCLKGA